MYYDEDESMAISIAMIRFRRTLNGRKLGHKIQNVVGCIWMTVGPSKLIHLDKYHVINLGAKCRRDGVHTNICERLGWISSVLNLLICLQNDSSKSLTLQSKGTLGFEPKISIEEE
jgi:hypothetical protein